MILMCRSLKAHSLGPHNVPELVRVGRGRALTSPPVDRVAVGAASVTEIHMVYITTQHEIKAKMRTR